MSKMTFQSSNCTFTIRHATTVIKCAFCGPYTLKLGRGSFAKVADKPSVRKAIIKPSKSMPKHTNIYISNTTYSFS